MITFVTSFMKLPEDRPGTKTVDFYFLQFKRLVDSGINIHLFLQESMIEKYKEIVGEPKNVYIQIQEFEDLDIYKKTVNIKYNLPAHRNHTKDTTNYMIINHSKIYFIKNAIESNIYNSTHFAWIDFGIGHVIKNDNTLLNLNNINIKSGLYIPGCHSSNTVVSDSICWRFCGGFFIGDKDSLLEFYNLYEANFELILKTTGVLSWEVNTWAYFEKYLNWKPIWYYGDHNDSMLENLPNNSLMTSGSL